VIAAFPAITGDAAGGWATMAFGDTKSRPLACAFSSCFHLIRKPEHWSLFGRTLIVAVEENETAMKVSQTSLLEGQI
jgi:hypothetical protein